MRRPHLAHPRFFSMHHRQLRYGTCTWGDARVADENVWVGNADLREGDLHGRRRNGTGVCATLLEET